MPGWGEIFADPAMQGLKPNPALMALIPGWQAAGCRRVLDAGCGVGRHLLPLLEAGFQVWGADCDAQVLTILQGSLANSGAPAVGVNLVQADLSRLPFSPGAFDLAVSLNVINHGDAATFRDYCRELARVLKAGGHLFINVSPREFAEKVQAAPDPGAGARHPGGHRHPGRRHGAPLPHPGRTPGAVSRVYRPPAGDGLGPHPVHGERGDAPTHFLGGEGEVSS